MSWIEMAVSEDPEVVKSRAMSTSAARPISGESPEVEPQVELAGSGGAGEAMPSATEPEVGIRATKAVEYFGKARGPSMLESGSERRAMEDAPKSPTGQSPARGDWWGMGEGNGPSDLVGQGRSAPGVPVAGPIDAPPRLEPESPTPSEKSAAAVVGNGPDKFVGVPGASMPQGSMIAPRAPKIGPIPESGEKAEPEAAKPETNWISDYSNSFIRGAFDQGVGSALQGLTRGAANQLKYLPRPIANVLTHMVLPLPSLLVPSDKLRNVYIKGLNFAADGIKTGREKLREATPVSDEFANSVPGGLVNALGQFVGTAPAYLVPGLGPAVSLGQIYDQAYNDALEHGASEEKANEAAIMNLPAGAIDYVADKFVIGKFLKGAKGKMSIGKFVMGLGESMVKEGLTEGAQQAWGNWVAKTLSGYDPDRPIDDQVIASLLIGGLTAGTISAAGGLKSGGRKQHPGGPPVARDTEPPVLNGMTGQAGLAQPTLERREALVDPPKIEGTRLSGIRSLEEQARSSQTSERVGKSNSAEQPSVVEPGSAGTSSSATEPATLPAEGGEVESREEHTGTIAEPNTRETELAGRVQELAELSSDAPPFQRDLLKQRIAALREHIVQSGRTRETANHDAVARRKHDALNESNPAHFNARRPPEATTLLAPWRAERHPPVVNSATDHAPAASAAPSIRAAPWGVIPMTARGAWIETGDGRRGQVLDVGRAVVTFRMADGHVSGTKKSQVRLLPRGSRLASSEQANLARRENLNYEQVNESAQNSEDSRRSGGHASRYSADNAEYSGKSEAEGGDIAPDGRSLDALRRFYEVPGGRRAHLRRLGITQREVAYEEAPGGMAMSTRGELLWSREGLREKALLTSSQYRRDLLLSVTMEEMIHRIHRQVENDSRARGGVRWIKLDTALRGMVQSAYTSTSHFGKLGIEYIRMLVQVRGGYTLSEEFYADTAGLRSVLMQPQAPEVERLIARIGEILHTGSVNRDGSLSESSGSEETQHASSERRGTKLEQRALALRRVPSIGLPGPPPQARSAGHP